MPVIENDYLKVTYNLKGAELESIYDKVAQKELLYEIDDRSWHHKDVIIFPFVARLKNGEYDHFG